MSQSWPLLLLEVDVSVEESVESEWNVWYDTVHLPAVSRCPGFVSSSRYVSEVGGARRYKTLYVLDDEKALNTHEFAEARGWYQFSGQVEARVRTFRRLDGEVAR